MLSGNKTTHWEIYYYVIWILKHLAFAGTVICYLKVLIKYDICEVLKRKFTLVSSFGAFFRLTKLLFCV